MQYLKGKITYYKRNVVAGFTFTSVTRFWSPLMMKCFFYIMLLKVTFSTYITITVTPITRQSDFNQISHLLSFMSRCGVGDHRQPHYLHNK